MQSKSEIRYKRIVESDSIALNKPIVSIFGSVPAHVYGPLNNYQTQVVLSREVPESESDGAMSLIKPAEVFEEINRILTHQEQQKKSVAPS